MSKEEAPTLAAGALTAGSVRLEGGIGTRAHDHPDSETILAKATMELNRHATEASLIEKQIARADTFTLGMKFRHDIHGAGVVIEILPDGKRKMEFQNGETHAYKPSSMHKLHPIVDDAHTFTPACAAALGVPRLSHDAPAAPMSPSAFEGDSPPLNPHPNPNPDPDPNPGVSGCSSRWSTRTTPAISLWRSSRLCTTSS